MKRSRLCWLLLGAVAGGCLLPEAQIVPGGLGDDDPTSGSGGLSGSAGKSQTGGNQASAGKTTSGGSDGSGNGGASMAGSAMGEAGMAEEGGSPGGGSDAGGSGGGGGGAGGAGGKSKTTFFVTSDTSPNGNLGGLTGADQRCQGLANAADFGDHVFRAYLSATGTNANQRIGTGPWFNSKGVMVAADLEELHAMSGNADLLLDEKGNKVNGLWPGSPTPNQHDILTGSTPAGMLLPGATCQDWTSSSPGDRARVGHSDGLGPGGSTSPPYNSWNSVHDNGSCADLTPQGGAGKLYCFAAL